jgi:hypothetical protein
MNSLGCPQGQVCDPARMRCVSCVGDNDCATDERCANSVCKKKCTSDNMCTPLGMLCDTARGYCVACLTSTDCKAEQYCSNGDCLADICTGGSSSCQNNTVVHCKTDGSGFDTPTVCATNTTCTVTSGMASCKSQVCTPTVTYCDPLTGSEKILVCSADGLTSTTKSDCATSSQVCVAGTCAAVVCPKAMKFCQGQDLRQCTAKGDASSVTQTCTATQYCDSTALACKPLMCTPNQPACAANVKTTCNADGSGFLPGGTDCSPQYCSNGACIDAFLRDNFEDMSFSQWTVSPLGNYTITAASSPGANGTNYALLLSKAANSTVPDGLSYTFPTPIQPKSISYWSKTSTTLSATGFTRFVNASGATPDILFYTYFGPNVFFNYAAGYDSTSLTVGTWYHIELRNIDWTARSFDLYVNGVALLTGVKFMGTSTSITRIELYNTEYSSTTSYSAYWDEFEILP